jgi:hypothetical protein
MIHPLPKRRGFLIINHLNSEQKANEETFMDIIDPKFISYFYKPLRIYSWSLIEK